MTASVQSVARTILVVDDQPVLASLIEASLVSAGYLVIQARSGREALELFAARSPDLVLLDILMPDMDGFETLSRLRRFPNGPQTPVVFLTALGDPDTHQRALESGADDLLGKPVHRTELLMRVRSLLWIKRLRDELHDSLELIRSQRDALMRAQRQKEELTTLLVHDLKSPLASMLAGTEFLSKEPGLSAEGSQCASEVLESGEALQRMVMDLLDISRSEDGALVPNCTDLDLGELVSRISGRVARIATARGISIETNVCKAPHVRADKELVRRVLENLVDNALKVSPRGAKIRLEALKGDGVADIRVLDQGPGIPGDLREKVFEKYVRLEQAASEHTRNGRGLGLAFCRIAVEAHCGWIWVEQNRPKGSIFCVRLPA